MVARDESQHIAVQPALKDLFAPADGPCHARHSHPKLLTCRRFEGAFDLRALVGATQEGRVLNPVQLNGVASTVQVGQGLQAATRQSAALSRLVVPVEPPVADMLARIRHSIEPDDARILDHASAALGELRRRRRDNAQALRRDIEDWARRLHAQGISERAQVNGACSQFPPGVC